MNEPRYVNQINEHNPFNINIEFNINGRRHHDATDIKDKRINIDTAAPKQIQSQYQPSRTPDPAQTDRNTYNKDTDYLQPMDDPRLKKKSKRNSMDMNTMTKNVYPHSQIVPKSKQKVLMQTQLFKKTELPKKKRSYSKYEGEAFKKSLWQGASKSVAIETKSGRKGHYNPSLKNIIHKIVNNQLSKRSLGTSFSKGKSPYQLQTPCGSSTSRKKQKKKNLTSKSDRDIKAESSLRNDEIVEKLNSLKSMTASILRSEIQQPEIPYYSKKKQRIHIQTQHDIDFIEEIAFYEKKAHREHRRQDKRQSSNIKQMQQTNELIETYIRLLEDNQAINITERETSRQDLHPELEITLPEVSQMERRQDGKIIRATLSREMENLFEESLIGTDRLPEPTSHKFLEKQQQEEKGGSEIDQIKPFLSSQIIRGGLSQQLQRFKLQELKKQEIQKWGYLLEFIKKNMSGQEADTQSILNEVYQFLERSKNDLQKDLIHEPSKKSGKKEMDEQFTVKYSENRSVLSENRQFYNSSAELDEDEDVASFKEEYATDENQDIKLLNLETISGALKHRKQNLMMKRDKELTALDLKRESGKLSQRQFDEEKERILKWIKTELEQISKARKNIWKGYREARGILDKNMYSRQYEEQSTAGKMMKCLSETYLKKNSADYASQIMKNNNKPKIKSNKSSKKQSSEQSEQSSYGVKSESQKSEGLDYNEDFQDENNSDFDEDIHPTPPLGGSQELSLQKSEEMEAIKERLMKMKHEHFTGDEPGDNISYEEVERELQENYSDEEIAILNKQMGTTPSKGFDSLETKLKYCCAEDKEDIFEFIFLDLCIQLYQESCVDNRIMKSVNRFVTRAQAQANKKKGVKTNLNVVKEYLKRFSSFLLRTNKQCLVNLNKPMGPSAIQMLRYMHDGDYDVKDEEEDVPTFIVPVQSFEKFQQSLLPTLEFEQYYDDSEKEEARVSFLKTILHIHNRALFDSLNQFMDHERPFGIWGAPFPWKRSATFTRGFTEEQLEEKLKKGTEKVVEQCSYVCGLLIDKQESLVGSAKVSDSYIEQIREDRLSRMLANELVESEERWLFYDDEQTEVLVEMGSFVWNSLMKELKAELSMINSV